MPLRVLIVPDKFKGTLTARAAAAAIARGWRKARPHDLLDLLPMSDGGDGFGEVTRLLLKAGSRRVRTLDAAHRPCMARWWWEPQTHTAIVESAGVIGLVMLPAKGFHPFKLDTFGLGAVLRAAARKGARRCLVGLGGSATNDGGFGVARALGWQFLDGKGQAIESWRELGRLKRIGAPACRRWFESLVVATDVQNPLLGPRGATRIYGPQKGLRRREFALAERCLRRLARVVQRQFGRDLAHVPGAGAAGGLGFGLMAFLGAELRPGFDLFARQAALERRLRAAALVVTGEGSIDGSTLMGKGVGEIARRCRELGIPCIGVAGMVKSSKWTAAWFAQTHALTDMASVRQAQSEARPLLERLARHLAASLETDGANRQASWHKTGCQMTV
jgi:glycerate 2-kinase